jgi:hypothetical protein
MHFPGDVRKPSRWRRALTFLACCGLVSILLLGVLGSANWLLKGATELALTTAASAKASLLMSAASARASLAASATMAHASLNSHRANIIRGVAEHLSGFQNMTVRALTAVEDMTSNLERHRDQNRALINVA